MTSARKTLGVFGAKGATIRVLVHDDDTVRVQWYEGPRGAKRPRAKDWPNTPAGRTEAKAWAKGFAEARVAPKLTAPLTLRELWTRYAEAEFPHLRARSQQLYGEYWRYFERMWGRDFAAELATMEMLDQLRTTLTRRGIGVTTLGEIIRTVKRVYRWGEKRELLSRNRLALYEYRVRKDDRRESPDEYRAEDFVKLLAAFDPMRAEQWRPFVALSICGFQGVRQRAALNLTWADVDRVGGVITWRAEFDKLGREWEQPLRVATRSALEIAQTWRDRTGYRGPWVLPAGSAKSRRATYSPQSLWAALRSAETRAAITHSAGRAAHGLRRLLAGEVNAATGNATLAMHAIGDTDLRMMTRYLKKRDDRVKAAFEQLDEEHAARTAPEAASSHRNQTVTEAATSEETAAQGGANA